ncbi:DUF1365 domain-containing protein [Paracoccus caeni]|uniref:DUF1365 domain-containing protein n=2 Tax=Paracoccus caeni TaxID=657651 RepID=A0A934SFF8_9RHOB|nr:DUF1365 domain-containing protein [Paracoccus caeni]
MLAERLHAGQVLHMPADVTHARRGAIRHAFRYRVDYLLLSPETAKGPALLSLNRFNLFAVHDRDHGGLRGKGVGASWAWDQLAQAGFERTPGMVMALLTQPRLLGHWFTPVSFWLVLRGDEILAAIAEVNNTFGQRHSYLCVTPGFTPIGPDDDICTRKLFHVSPFQDVAGEYRFAFRLTPDHIGIRIAQIDSGNGLDAAMTGALRPFGNAAAIGACLRRPGGSLRVLALIYWNALRLKLKGAAYRPVPAPPDKDVS